MFAGEAFEMRQRIILVEGLDIGFERVGGVEDARAAAGGFLRVDRVRRAVGAEEEFGRARGRGLAHGEAVMLALRYRPAIDGREDAADEHRGAVSVELMGAAV